MSFDLTNKNISDTFQNVLQVTGSDGNELFDLQGNPEDVIFRHCNVIHKCLKL